jgi:hypothetical protein
VKKLYGSTPVGDFGPFALKAVRQGMIGDGLSRTGINHAINRLRQIFKWGVENEMVAPTVLHGLQAVGGLRYGRTDAHESEPVGVFLWAVWGAPRAVAMEHAAAIDVRVSTRERSHCHTQQPRQGFRNGVCADCGPDTLSGFPEPVLRKALWQAMGGAGVGKIVKERIRQIDVSRRWTVQQGSAWLRASRHDCYTRFSRAGLPHPQVRYLRSRCAAFIN